MKETGVACPSEETMFAFLDGEVDAATQLAVLRHLSECEDCREVFAEMVTMQDLVTWELQSAPPSAETISTVGWRLTTNRIVRELRTAGYIRRRRPDAKKVALRLARGAAEGTRVAAAVLFGGVKMAYGGATALAKIAGGVSNMATRLTGRSPWRLAW